MGKRIIPEVPGYNKVDVVSFVKAKIKTNDDWARRAVVVLYEQQTVKERREHLSCGHNNVGFGRMDSPLLTKIAIKVKQNRWTPEDMEILRRKLSRYAAQLICLAYDKDKHKNLKKQLDLYYKNSASKLPF